MKRDKSLIERLRAAQACVATVESCTGGEIARRLTSVAGASQVYWGGWVTYDNSAKISQTHVPAALLRQHGAVSAEVARAMAEGGLFAMRETIAVTSEAEVEGLSTLSHQTRFACVATTGIAGPGGGTAAKPVGLCYVALASSDRGTVVIELRRPPEETREQHQSAFADAAWALLEGWA